jgi:hypothetical protein
VLLEDVKGGPPSEPVCPVRTIVMQSRYVKSEYKARGQFQLGLNKMAAKMASA